MKCFCNALSFLYKTGISLQIRHSRFVTLEQTQYWYRVNQRTAVYSTVGIIPSHHLTLSQNTLLEQSPQSSFPASGLAQSSKTASHDGIKPISSELENVALYLIHFDQFIQNDKLHKNEQFIILALQVVERMSFIGK
jgi:hypothetical protein